MVEHGRYRSARVTKIKHIVTSRSEHRHKNEQTHHQNNNHKRLHTKRSQATTNQNKKPTTTNINTIIQTNTTSKPRDIENTNHKTEEERVGEEGGLWRVPERLKKGYVSIYAEVRQKSKRGGKITQEEIYTWKGGDKKRRKRLEKL